MATIPFADLVSRAKLACDDCCVKVSEENAPTIDSLLNKYDQTANLSATIRDHIVEKLYNAVDDLDLAVHGGSDPDVTNAKLSLVDKLLSTLKDRDKSMETRINLRLKLKSQEDNADFGKAAAELLKRINLSERATNMVPHNEELDTPEVDELFEERAKELGVHEVQSTELREDAFDFSQHE